MSTTSENDTTFCHAKDETTSLSQENEAAGITERTVIEAMRKAARAFSATSPNAEAVVAMKVRKQSTASVELVGSTLNVMVEITYGLLNVLANPNIPTQTRALARQHVEPIVDQLVSAGIIGQQADADAANLILPILPLRSAAQKHDNRADYLSKYRRLKRLGGGDYEKGRRIENEHRDWEMASGNSD